MSIERLCDLHDKSYTRQAVLDNHLNSRTRELVQTIKNAKEKLNVVLAREKHREQLITDLKLKCDRATEDFEKNPTVKDLRFNVMKLAT